MGLTTALLAATSGLHATQTGLDLVSRNIANATTPGYTRKSVPQTPLIVGGQGQGVRLGEIERQVNSQLQYQVRSGISESEAYRVRDDFLSRFELSFGKPGDGTSIASQLSQLSDAFASLMTSPDVLTAQTAAVSKAEAFARGMNDVANQVQSLRTEAEDNIKTSVDTINAKLKAIDDLNSQITQAKALGQSTADLEDRRDSFLDDLSKEIDINYFTRDNGEVWVMTKSGESLLDGSIHTLSFNNIPQLSANQSYPLSLNGVMLDGKDITGRLSGGRLKGLFDLRDQILPQAQLQLDELASKVTTLFSGNDLELFMDSGSTFNVANTTGYANRIMVNPAVKSEPWRMRDGTVVATENTNTGDITIPRNIVDMMGNLQTFPGTTGLGTSFTLQGYAAAFITFQGTQRADTSDQLQNQSVLTEALQNRFTNDSGVNVNDEMTLMIQLQSSFGANAKMIQAVKEMYDQLLQVV